MIWGPLNSLSIFLSNASKAVVVVRYHVLLGCYPVFLFALCSPMHFSQSFIYKCLLTDQTSPHLYGAVKLMPRAQEEKKQKREAIILSIRRRFLLLFHPLEAQEVHPQTIWYLEIGCLGGMPWAQQHPQGPRGSFTSPPPPSFLWRAFTSQVPLSHFCQCISSWPATPVLHYSAENSIHTVIGKLYLICQPCSAPERLLELIHYAAFDSLLLRGWVKVLGNCRKGQGL